MQLADRLGDVEQGIVAKTRWRVVDLANSEACGDTIRWWEEQTSNGGEGMVVKPRAFFSRGAKGLLQPALKVRGREYLQIIPGRNTMRQRTSRGFASAVYRVREIWLCVNSRSVTKHSSGLWRANRLGAYTNAFSGFSPLRANLLTPAYECSETCNWGDRGDLGVYHCRRVLRFAIRLLRALRTMATTSCRSAHKNPCVRIRCKLAIAKFR